MRSDGSIRRELGMLRRIQVANLPGSAAHEAAAAAMQAIAWMRGQRGGEPSRFIEGAIAPPRAPRQRRPSSPAIEDDGERL